MKSILIDCDGVLYPLKELHTKEIVDAVKYVYRYNVGLKDTEQRYVSAKTISENHLGIFNYIKEICKYKNYDFNLFCQEVCEHIDYTKIKENQQLWKLITKAAEHYDINIFSNNSRPHLEAVTDRVFSKNIEQLTKNGIKVYDITATEHDGYFYPKQHDDGFSLFLKKIKINPSDVILFDDAPINISQAKKIGMEAILISEDNPLEKQILRLLKEINRNMSAGNIYKNDRTI